MSPERVVLEVTSPSTPTAEALARLPVLLGASGHPVSAVVEVDPHVSAGERRSRWTLHLGRGPGTWTQRDEVDPGGRAGRSTLVDGPLSGLDLSWAVRDEGPGSVVELDLDVRTGMAHLAGALDPVLARVLLDAVRVALDAELGGTTVREGHLVLADPVVV